MINVAAALRGAITWLRTTLGAAGVPLAADAELEQHVRRLVDELKHAPVVQPSRDLAQAVIDRLQQHGANDRPPPADN